MFDYRRSSIAGTPIENQVKQKEYAISHDLSRALESQHDINKGYPKLLNAPEIYMSDFFTKANDNPSMALRTINRQVFGCDSCNTNSGGFWGDEAQSLKKLFNANEFAAQREAFINKLQQFYPKTNSVRGVLLSMNRIGGMHILPKMTAEEKSLVIQKLRESASMLKLIK